MGKYNQIFASEETAVEELSSEEGVAAIAIVAAFADADGSDLEAAAMAGMLADIDIFDDYSLDELSEMVSELTVIADRDGLGALFNAAVESLSDDLLAIAFAAGVTMVIIDGEVPDEEKDFIYQLQQALEISDEEAIEIIDGVVAGLKEEDNN